MVWVKFSRAIEYHHAMPLYVVLSENRCNGNHTVSNSVNDVWPYFLHFTSSLSKFRHRNCLQKLTESLRVLWKRFCISGRNWFLLLLSIFFVRFWVKFGARNLNIMIWSFYEFRPNRSREERIFLMNHKLTHTHTHNSTCSVKIYDVLKAKNALVKFLYHVTENTLCSLIFVLCLYAFCNCLSVVDLSRSQAP